MVITLDTVYVLGSLVPGLFLALGIFRDPVKVPGEISQECVVCCKETPGQSKGIKWQCKVCHAVNHVTLDRSLIWKLRHAKLRDVLPSESMAKAA